MRRRIGIALIGLVAASLLLAGLGAIFLEIGRAHV